MNVPVTLPAALLLGGAYLVGHPLLPWGRNHPRRWLSLAAGASMAYVFLDVLPELGARHRAFVAVVGEVPYVEHRLYAIALAGFVFLYALDVMVRRAGHRAAPHGEGPRKDALRETSGDEPYGDRTRKKPGGERLDGSRLLFWIHIAGYSLYGSIIGDALVSRGREGVIELALYVTAMVLHLLVVSTALGREHGGRYLTRGRWVLAASVVAGWAFAVVAPLSEVVLARLFAFVAGGVLMTSANEELPREKDGRFGWFAFGAGAYGVLLLLA